MKAKDKKINLLPKEYIQAEKVKKGLMAAGVVVALEVAAFISFVAIPPKTELQQTMVQLDNLSYELDDDRFSEVNLMIQQLEDAKADVNVWMARYKDLKSENFISKRVLDSLMARVPMDLTINTITVTPEKKEDTNPVRTIQMVGYSAEAIAVLNYTTVIEQIFGAGTTTYEVSYNKDLMVYEYTITVTIPVESKQTEAVAEETTSDTAEASPATTEGGAN